MHKRLFEKIFFNRKAVFVHDVLMVPLALYAAFWVRYDLNFIPPSSVKLFQQLLVGALPAAVFSYLALGLYRGMWRFASLPDLVRILKSVALVTLLIMVGYFQYNRLSGIPRTVIFLFPLFLVCGLAAPRLLYRCLRDGWLKMRIKEGKRILVVGAGQGGELLLRDLLHHKKQFNPVALVDDNPATAGREVHGVPVLGNLTEIKTIVDDLDIEMVVIAIPSAPHNLFKKVAAVCSEAGVECSTLPALAEINEQNGAVNQLRSLTLEDLLGRDPVQLDEKSIAGYLQGKPILVTGAGGSIGSELCRQVAAQRPSRLIIFDHGEFNIYAIDHELRKNFPNLEIITVLGDVKNYERVDWVFKKFQPQVIFHAAAYKHVPMIELNPAEGVANNVKGSCTVADAADRYGAEAFVFVSTDKAVNPANVMGTTKRIAEIYCQNLAKRSTTRFITTRFGNVLGSAGSVVPLFEQQIHDGGPVTVTHKDITRYFMTIPEAVSLILQAGAMGEGGEIFVLDMGEPVRIRDLADQMIRLSGLTPDKDIDIVYTGLRPGEKLFEEIFHERENLRGTKHPKLFLAGSRKVEWQWLVDELDSLAMAATSRDVPRLINHLRRIVPEYEGPHLSDQSGADQQPQLKVVG